ncbi:MAG TPA: serine hydrolase [Terriglobia bacterium]|nr:serine hydrolase [Terriglobia bacterium]
MVITHRRFALLLVVIFAISAFVSMAIASVRTNPARSEGSPDQLGASRRVQADARGSVSALPAGPDVPRMEQVIQSFVSDQHFMGSVLVARGNEIILDKGYGFAILEWGVANSPATKFRLGSITKQFTAASILLLEERGKLSISDPVKKYMPDAPAAWDKITIFNLLTHTSGIPNFTSFPDYASLEPFTTTPTQLVKLFRDKPLDFPPGEKMSYSNSGYVLLGYLIEKISGESYEKFVQENIFTPLGMKDSGYDSNSAIIPHRAAGYSPGPNGPINAGYINMTVPLSAGGLYSTTEDLLRWEQGLFGGKLLSPASLQKMTTPFKNDYACGLMVHTANGRKLIAHGGGIEGFNTILAYYPEDNLTVVALSNINGQAPQDIAAKLAALAHGEKVVLLSERKEVPVDPKLFEGYVGNYELAPKFILTVTREDDKLITQATGQPKVPIFAESEREFFAKAVDAQFTFVTDAQGRATELILHQGGDDVHAKRLEGEVPQPKEHKEITLDPKRFDGYVGQYQLAPNFILTITREGDALFAQATGQSKVQIFPEGEREFFYKVVDAQITFETDSAGRATSLTLHQNGANTPAKRVQ